jgi:Phage-related protein, tail component
MLRKIKLYGRLAKFIGKRVLHADVASTAEAVRFLLANWPQLEGHMSSQHYRVSVGNYELTEDELGHPIGQQEIKFVPVVSGAGATGRIIAGIALIALAAFVPLGLPIINQIVMGIGASLVLGGVAELLTPTPRVPQGPDTQDDPRKSYSFSSIQNTSRQGTPVQIVYGRCIVGSVVISGGIDTVQVVG